MRMKDSLSAVGGALDADPDDDEYIARLDAWLAGTYTSGWPVLKKATASAALGATRATCELLKTASRIERKSSSRGEASFLVDSNYDIECIGPCLSATLLASFSLEGFLRLGMIV